MIGHNNPPDPIDESVAEWSDHLAESDNWLDGTPVENEAQMNTVDEIIKALRKCKANVERAQKAETGPLRAAWQAELDRWKPTQADIARRLTGLAAIVDPLKRKLNEEKEAAKRAAYDESRRLAREAEAAAAEVNAGNLAAVNAVAKMKAKAMEAEKAAAAANKDKVKGLRTVTRYEITDPRAVLYDIAENDQPALQEMVAEYVRLNHKNRTIAGVRVWKEKEAF